MGAIVAKRAKTRRERVSGDCGDGYQLIQELSFVDNDSSGAKS
jgi:hypothetical protein